MRLLSHVGVAAVLALACGGGNQTPDAGHDGPADLTNDPVAEVQEAAAEAPTDGTSEEALADGGADGKAGPPMPVMAASVGSSHICAVGKDRALFCWGRADRGQLGEGSPLMPIDPPDSCSYDGTDLPAIPCRRRPHLVDAGMPVVQVAAGQDFTCALREDGEVRCFGFDLFGDLGDGGVTPTTCGDWPCRVFPTANPGIKAVAITRGCALQPDGHVACWGPNRHGRLGIGSTDEPLVASMVVGIDNAVQIAAGGDFACARLTGGSVKCWGSFHGIGDGTTMDRPAPKTVPGLDDVVDIACGSDHACALKTDGSALCWGANESDQRGFEGSSETSLPELVPDLPPARRIFAGSSRTCALTKDGRLFCWGTQQFGYIGYRCKGGTDCVGPRDEVLSDVEEVSMNDERICAGTAKGELYCWGFNSWWQLGDGTMTDRNRPVLISLE